MNFMNFSIFLFHSLPQLTHPSSPRAHFASRCRTTTPATVLKFCTHKSCGIDDGGRENEGGECLRASSSMAVDGISLLGFGLAMGEVETAKKSIEEFSVFHESEKQHELFPAASKKKPLMKIENSLPPPSGKKLKILRRCLCHRRRRHRPLLPGSDQLGVILRRG